MKAAKVAAKKAGKKVTETQVIQKMAADRDFQAWMGQIGEWSKLQQKNPYCYNQMSCLEKIEYDVSRTKALSDKNKTDYKFSSVAAIAPRGQGGGIPLIFSTAWIDPQWLDIGKNNYVTNTTTTKKQTGTEKVQVGQRIKKSSRGRIIERIYETKPVYEDVTNTATARRSLTNTERIIGNYGAVAGGILFANTVPKTGTKSQKQVKNDSKNRYEGVKQQARKKKQNEKNNQE